MTSKNIRKPSLFASYCVFLTGRKSIPPPRSIFEEAHRHSTATTGFNTGTSHGFGAGENDWLGAEAYVDPLH